MQGHSLFLAFHESSQPVGDGCVDVQDVIYFLLELGRMGRLAKDSGLARAQLFAQGTVATSSVGIQDIARVMVALAHGLLDLLIAVGGSADEAGDAPMGFFG